MFTSYLCQMSLHDWPLTDHYEFTRKGHCMWQQLSINQLLTSFIRYIMLLRSDQSNPQPVSVLQIFWAFILADHSRLGSYAFRRIHPVTVWCLRQHHVILISFILISPESVVIPVTSSVDKSLTCTSVSVIVPARNVRSTVSRLGR